MTSRSSRPARPARRTLAIVGAGLAGAKAAEAARNAGFDGRLVLVGDEPSVPYERPPLSKGVLRGEDKAASARVHPAGFYDDHAIELVHDRAAALDVTARCIEVASGGAPVPIDVLVLATGASPRRLTVPGADLHGIHHLRTLDDAARLRDAIRGAARVAVVGAGWIGSEVTASARQMGADVVLIDPAPVPLQRVLGGDVGALFRELHADHGVVLRLGAGVAELRGAKTVEEVVLDDGRVEPADVVVVGIGVLPRVGLAAGAGLAVDGGIVADQHLRTSMPGVYAAGDVASAWHPRYRRHVRVEHWSNALHQGTLAGRNAATGGQEVYDRLPYFFSDQYDLGMEYVGLSSPGDTTVIERSSEDEHAFRAFWHRDGIVTAAMHANTWGVLDELRALVGSEV